MREVSIITGKEISSLWNVKQKIVDTAIYLKSIEKDTKNTDQMLENIFDSKKDRTLVDIMKSLICYKSENGHISSGDFSKESQKFVILNRKNRVIESFANCYASFLKNPNTYFYF